jgi:hypothetical protein
VIVPVGLDPITKRYSYEYRQAPTLEEAEKVRDKMLADMAKGRQPRNEATFSQLLDAVAEVAHLDLSTRVTYQSYTERTIRPALGDYTCRHLEQHPELLDRRYAALSRWFPPEKTAMTQNKDLKPGWRPTASPIRSATQHSAELLQCVGDAPGGDDSS